MSIHRFRVRTPDQGWEVHGPDLLRTKPNAARTMLDMVPRHRKIEVRYGALDWRPVKRGDLLATFDGWKGANLFVVAVLGRVTGRRHVVSVVQHVEVPLLDLGPEESGSTKQAWSLFKAQYPAARFGGAYVYKETSPGYWSDHAWGTAVDVTENRPEGVTNDAVTSWASRMAASGNLVFDYALGSMGGRVVQVNANGGIVPSGAADSHLWHVHVSVIDHDGRKPPRTGGVW